MKYILFKPESGEDFVIKKDCIESMQKIVKKSKKPTATCNQMFIIIRTTIVIRTTSGNQFTITEAEDGFEDILASLEE